MKTTHASRTRGRRWSHHVLAHQQYFTAWSIFLPCSVSFSLCPSAYLSWCCRSCWARSACSWTGAARRTGTSCGSTPRHKTPRPRSPRDARSSADTGSRYTSHLLTCVEMGSVGRPSSLTPWALGNGNLEMRALSAFDFVYEYAPPALPLIAVSGWALCGVQDRRLPQPVLRPARSRDGRPFFHPNHTKLNTPLPIAND